MATKKVITDDSDAKLESKVKKPTSNKNKDGFVKGGQVSPSDYFAFKAKQRQK